MSTMTLEQVRNRLRSRGEFYRVDPLEEREMADAIDAEIQRRASAQGEAVAWQYRRLDGEEGPSPYWHDMTKEQYERFRDTRNRKCEIRELLTRTAARASGPEVFSEVLAELEKAIRKFPTWPTDPLHAVGVFNEEAGELSKAVLQQVYEPHKNSPDEVRKEAKQAAAMALRFLVSLDTYDWTPGKQHEQPALAASPSAESDADGEVGNG